MRERITITISKNLLEELDKSIDGLTIRSRSQAIEFFLSKFLKADKINNAIVIVPNIKIKKRPFEFFKIGDKPLLQIYLEHLQKMGIQKFNVVVKRKSKKISKILKNFNSKQITIKEIQKITLGEQALLCYANKFVFSNLEKLLTFHKANNAKVTAGIVISSKKPRLIMDGTIVTSIDLKPKAKIFHSSTGHYIISQEVLKRKILSIDEVSFLKNACKEKILYGYLFEDDCLTINNLKDIKALKRMLK
ncbi:MAG: hypothetical protein DRO04_02335 [Candidatus Iainarchaeum archaeon]|uniref:Uncharacterized protein n=1 Tax=Candidatus Iainarchaeum sp. TaxID=3101447 RepID=A0A497JH94_9ARCH|nr:MAG: hypothetical protein DRO04_02335 [Candidatus Diapherotrites archaeon]